MAKCQIPPLGWWCSREAGHSGPCAAREVTTANNPTLAVHAEAARFGVSLSHTAAACIADAAIEASGLRFSVGKCVWLIDYGDGEYGEYRPHDYSGDNGTCVNCGVGGL